MDLSPFFSGGAASAHLAQSETLSAAYGAFRANKSAAGDFEAVFAAEMPYILLLWRQHGTVLTSGHQRAYQQFERCVLLAGRASLRQFMSKGALP